MNNRNYILGICIFIIGSILASNILNSSSYPDKKNLSENSTLLKRSHITGSPETAVLTSSISSPQRGLRTSQVQDKLLILDEIFKNKNDNDPRLDQEFKSLDSLTKKALEEKYDSLKVEQRNERGTIVFLLGKNLQSKNDFEFLKKVLKEPTCLSLQDCKKNPEGIDPEDLTTVEITLSYPQIVALKSVENYLDHHPTSVLAKDVLNQALGAENPYVKQMATRLKTRWFN